MMIDLRTTQNEVKELIDDQIQVFKKDGLLSADDLTDCQLRFSRINQLFREIDREKDDCTVPWRTLE